MYPPFQRPTREEREEYRARKRAANERRRKERIASANRKAKIPAPQPGVALYFTTQRGIKRRARAGILFGDAAPTQVDVIDASDEQIEERQKKGETVVNPDGAERLLYDTGRKGGLMLVGMPTELAVAEARREVQGELAAKDDRIAALEAQLAQARGNATAGAGLVQTAAATAPAQPTVAPVQPTAPDDGRPQRLPRGAAPKAADAKPGDAKDDK